MFKYFNNVWHIKSQKARPSHLLGPRAEGFALYLVSVHDSHCLHHSGISTYFDKDSSVCHFFPSNNFFRSYMLHIWFKGLFVWKPSTPLTFSCHVRSFTFIFISFLTPEIYLCIWKTPDRLSCRRDLWGYYADLPHEEINSGQEIQCRHRSLLLANVSFDGSCLLNALVKSRRRFLRMITLIILSLTQLSGKNRCY